MTSDKLDKPTGKPFDPSSYDPSVEPIRFVIYAFKFCGLWPKKYRFRRLYLVHSFLFQFWFTFAFVGFKLLNFYFKTHMDMATIIIFESLAEISMCIRVINFIVNFDDITNCLETVKSFKCQNEEEVRMYEKTFALFTKVLRFYFGCASFACFFSLCAPFFSGKPMLAYPAWYPFLDWRNVRSHFWIAWTYQLVGILCLAHGLILLMAFQIYLMIAIGGQLDILAKRLEGLGTQYLDLPDHDRQQKTLALFLDDIKEFEVISELIAQVESLFNYPFFYQVICSAIIFCVTAFQIFRLDDVSKEIVNFSFYISFSATMMNEIFLPCYFGNEVTLKREQLPFAIYSSQWIHLSQKFKKNMIIFLEGLKRVRILKSGKIFTLSLFSFLTVINRSYSLFAVLRNFIK